jgi:hypothetical protein
MYAFDSGGIDADTAGMALPRAGDFEQARKFFQFVIDKVSEKKVDPYFSSCKTTKQEDGWTCGWRVAALVQKFLSAVSAFDPSSLIHVILFNLGSIWGTLGIVCGDSLGRSGDSLWG